MHCLFDCYVECRLIYIYPVELYLNLYDTLTMKFWKYLLTIEGGYCLYGKIKYLRFKKYNDTLKAIENSYIEIFFALVEKKDDPTSFSLLQSVDTWSNFTV